ncbi:hypothetical protein [Altibacter sp. HG106]|uniref:hypothetical protein n=1 Tax=Altibacter sp. HG106 TaxID=3023937 RepID=UPI0023503A21|nr:hypothetical protein [Altibacter sp. HG106]MDC7995317.1 hypothetical protein [Altibacter sp. HG106]
MKTAKFFFVWGYSLMAFLFFGGMLFTIITQYPNWDHDLPNSLVATNNFYVKADPGTFFQLMGKINLPLFVVMIIFIWKSSKARNWMLLHFVLFVIIGLGTGLLVYPILYELGAEDIATRPLAEIEALLNQFKTLDTIRMFVAMVSVLALMIGLSHFFNSVYSQRAKL